MLVLKVKQVVECRDDGLVLRTVAADTFLYDRYCIHTTTMYQAVCSTRHSARTKVPFRLTLENVYTFYTSYLAKAR